MAASRVLILSAAIGEGHDLPARFLAAGLEAAGARADIADGLHAMGPFLERPLAFRGPPRRQRQDHPVGGLRRPGRQPVRVTHPGGRPGVCPSKMAPATAAWPRPRARQVARWPGRGSSAGRFARR